MKRRYRANVIGGMHLKIKRLYLPQGQEFELNDMEDRHQSVKALLDAGAIVRIASRLKPLRRQPTIERQASNLIDAAFKQQEPEPDVVLTETQRPDSPEDIESIEERWSKLSGKQKKALAVSGEISIDALKGFLATEPSHHVRKAIKGVVNNTLLTEQKASAGEQVQDADI